MIPDGYTLRTVVNNAVPSFPGSSPTSLGTRLAMRITHFTTVPCFQPILPPVITL